MSRANTLDRRAVTRTLLLERGDLLVVAGDHDLTFPLWGGMGGAAMIGLGLALAQPERPVLVLTGDGELLMGLGSLATLGLQRPANLAVVVLDNERYGETGMQETATAHGVDLGAIARACGFTAGETITAMEGVAALRPRLRAKQGPLFAQIKIAADSPPLALPPRDGGLLKSRFRAALLGPEAALA